jgi:hypothetical protein
MDDCCQGSTCPRFGTACALGGIGDPCQQNADCEASLTCSVWCTRACMTNADCGSTNYCISAGTSGLLCFPSCAGQNDTLNPSACTYLPDTTCENGLNPQNLMLPICSQ